jgi:hypothetical protein
MMSRNAVIIYKFLHFCTFNNAVYRPQNVKQTTAIC